MSSLLLIENLPLVLTTQIGTFAVEQPIAQRYGDLTKSRFPLLPMTATKFLAAGHPMQITRAFTGNLETEAFKFYTETANGITYTVVEFSAPVPSGTICSASGIGKRDSVTGVLLENPADILSDIMLIAARDDAWWQQLRTEASAAGIVLAGSIDTTAPIRSFIDMISDSSGAIWCPGMARLYPVPFEGFKIDLDRFSASSVVASAALADTADILRLTFDFDEVEGKSQSFIQLEASPSRFAGLSGRVKQKLFPAIHSGITAHLDLPMVRSPAIAESIGRRVLPWYAGERYDVAFTTPATEFIRPGRWVQLVDHPQWPFDADPMLMITGVTLSGSKKWARVQSETLLTTPTITLTAHSIGTNSIGSGGVEVTVKNGIATFTVLDPSGKPLVGAYASLDGAAPKKTDGQGNVAFVVTQSGQHELDITATGFLPLALTVTL